MDLQPYTIYSYVIEATNAFGSIQSAPISFRTPPGPPYGTVLLSVSNIKPKSAHFTWTSPSLMNGPLWKYILFAVTSQNSTEVNMWEGQEQSVTLMSLVPFTSYIFHVDTCTTGGCLRSEPVQFPTMSAVPEGMYPPVVMPINNTALHISWQPPAYPNGNMPILLYKALMTMAWFSLQVHKMCIYILCLILNHSTTFTHITKLIRKYYYRNC